MCVCVCVCVCARARACLVAQSCPTLCDPMDCSSPGSSDNQISQARILEWVAISSSRESSWPRDQTCFSCDSYIGRWILYSGATWEAYIQHQGHFNNCHIVCFSWKSLNWKIISCWILGMSFSHWNLSVPMGNTERELQGSHKD